MRKIKVGLEHDPRRGTYRLRWTVDGVTHRESLGVITRQEAERGRDVREVSLRAEALGVAASLRAPMPALRVGDVLDAYLLRLEEARGLTPYTLNTAGMAAQVRAKVGWVLVERLTTDDLSAYALARSREPGKLAGTRMKRSTIFNELAVLHRALAHAYRAGLIPTTGPQLPKRKVLPDDMRRRGLLREDEMLAMLAWIAQHPPRHPKAVPSEVRIRLLTVYYWLPARPAELVRLKVGDCALLVKPGLPRAERQIRFRQTKGGAGRGLRPLAETALEAIVEQLAYLGPAVSPDDWLWPSPQGGHILSRAVAYWVTSVAAAAGIEDVQPYDLRRHAVTETLRATGGDLEDAAVYTGHRETRTLLRYLRGDKDRAASVAKRIGWSRAPLRLVEGGED